MLYLLFGLVEIFPLVLEIVDPFLSLCPNVFIEAAAQHIFEIFPAIIRLNVLLSLNLLADTADLGLGLFEIGNGLVDFAD